MLNFEEVINIEDIKISSKEYRIDKRYKNELEKQLILEKWYERILKRENLSSEFFQETLIDFSDLTQENKYSNQNGISKRENIKKSIFTFSYEYGYFKVNVLSFTSTHIRVILKHYSPKNKLIMSGRCKFRNKKRSSKALLDLFLSYSDRVIKEKVNPFPTIEKSIPEKDLLPLKVFKSQSDYEFYKKSNQYKKLFMVA